MADVGILTSLASARATDTVAQIRANLASASGVDPESLWILGGELGYHVDVRWNGSELSGEMDVVFSRPDKRDPLCVTDFGSVPLPLKNWQEYANNPARSFLASRLPQVLIDYAKLKLPEYMAPAMVMVLEDLPRTPSGKVDRKALPAPSTVARTGSREFVAPRTENERTIAAIWIQLLGLEKVSVHDNFFELGGDSLVGFRAVNRANQAGLSLTLRMLFQHKSIAEIVKAMGVEVETKQPARLNVTRVSRNAHRQKLVSIR
jgi:hypothetical protein